MGYTSDNVAVISWRANAIKGDANIEELEAVISWMKAERKVKYSCSTCGQNAWAKPNARLICGDCAQPMIAQG